MADLNLRGYLDRFPEVCERKFGRRFDFAKIEKEFEQVRTGGSRLMARDVAKIFDKDRTPFGRYWPLPDAKALEKQLTRQHVFLSPIVGYGHDLVEQLLQVFHNLGVASLVLRMAHPDQFGVFSTPIVHLLQINRARTVDLYLAFCEELHSWQEHFGLPSVAQTEMALWTYHELTALPLHGAEVEKSRREFDNDVWIQRRRLEQVVTPFLENYGPVELARILCERYPRLAAMLAGVEFERLLRLRWRGLRSRDKGKQKVSADDMINDLAEHSVVHRREARGLASVWDVRNKAVHPDATLSREEVEKMISCIESICFDWEV